MARSIPRTAAAVRTTTDDSRDLYTPSRLNREARQLLERGFGSLWVEGEVSNLSRPASGHWYFSLKDDAAQLRCAMFRQRNVAVRFPLRDGMHVVARGRVSLYEPRGDYQFIVDLLEEAGEGALRRQFELLKAKLAAAGLFDTGHKQPLPALPRRIGVVTSPSGAAIRDILHVLHRRFPAIPVLIYPVPVQGQGAAAEIAEMIGIASARREVDVLILARGGGSLEDLWSFNEEVVARALYDCLLPVVSGVGHEIDFTIADFVADVRAPTPSGAAELVVPDQLEWSRALATHVQRLRQALERRLGAGRETLAWARRRLGQLQPGVRLRQHVQRVDELEQRLARALRHALVRGRGRLREDAAALARHSPALRLAAVRRRSDQAALRLGACVRQRLVQARGALTAAGRTLHAVSPLATLERGYAIVIGPDDRIVRRAHDVTIGARITARLARGRLHARVEDVEPDQDADAGGTTS
jgi:exodeoxyribonuclease VII large subunit